MKRRLPLQVVERSSLEVDVCCSLREAILSGKLGEGRLVQDELAASLGVSRTPVRTALKQLENEHLVTVDGHGGFFVKKVDVPDLQEVYALRTLLEPYATRMAVPRMISEDLADLRDLLQSMRDSVDDPDRYVELNMEFHRRIYQASELPRLSRMIEGNWAGLPPVTPKTVPGQLERSLEGHSSILSAIESGDAETAAALMETHIRTAGDKLVAMVVNGQSGR